MLFSPTQLHPLLDWKARYRAWVLSAVPPWTACISHTCCWLYLPVSAPQCSLMVKVFSTHLNVLHFLLVFLHRRTVLGHLERVWPRMVSLSQTLIPSCTFFDISLSTSGMIVNLVAQTHGRVQVRRAHIDWDGDDGYSPSYNTSTASTCSTQWPAWILQTQPPIAMLSDHNETTLSSCIRSKAVPQLSSLLCASGKCGVCTLSCQPLGCPHHSRDSQHCLPVICLKVFITDPLWIAWNEQLIFLIKVHSLTSTQ
jgi:hypothetical protein